MWYLGIDIAKAKFDVCLLHEEKQEKKVFKNNEAGFEELRCWLEPWSKAEGKIVMEASGNYGKALLRYLAEQGYWVAQVNPARIKGYAQSRMLRNKNDRLDAALIAHFAKTQEDLRHWEALSEEEESLKEMVRHLNDLKASQQQEKNRLEAQPSSAKVRESLQKHLAFLEEQIKDLEKLIRQHVNQYPDLKRQKDLLTSIPGLGESSAFQMMAECGNLTRFEDVRELVAFVGLHPQQAQSGSSLHYTKGISRMGPASLRAALYMPAIVAKRHNPILKVFADRLKASGLSGKEVVVAVMRKLFHLAYGILKSGQPFDPHFLAKMALAS